MEEGNEIAIFYHPYIGKKVRKVSNRPFKSRFKTNTVKGIIGITIPSHSESELLCFVFEEDESFVECRRCILIEDEVERVAV